MNRAMHRDPAVIVEEKQNRTCAGCGDLERDYTPGFRKFSCRKGRQPAKRDVFLMERCNKYRTGD